MKKIVFFLISFMAVIPTQGSMAANGVGYLPGIMSLLLDAPSTYNDIHSFLEENCARCHANGGGRYTVNIDIRASYDSAVTMIYKPIPDQSLLLRKPAGLDGHDGGQVTPDYAVGAYKYRLILKWITDGVLPPS